jgi:NADH-quinone oxidoreductase subunit A
MVCVIFFFNRLLAPSNPNYEKLTSYECGEEPTGNAWLPFNSRFYVIALIFLLFDVEMVFVFPWATVFGNHELIAADSRWGWFSLAEMFIFLGILILGLVYVWAKGDLEWIKAKPTVPTTDVNIPLSFYEQLNLEQGKFVVKPFSLTNEPVISNKPALPAETVAKDAPAAVASAKVGFKPTFKKPTNE